MADFDSVREELASRAGWITYPSESNCGLAFYAADTHQGMRLMREISVKRIRWTSEPRECERPVGIEPTPHRSLL